MKLANRRIVIFITVIAMFITFIIMTLVLTSTLRHYVLDATQRVVQSYVSYIKSSLNSIIVSHITTTNSGYFKLLNQQLSEIREHNKDILDILVLKILKVDGNKVNSIIISNSYSNKSNEYMQLSSYATDLHMIQEIKNGKTVFRKEYDSNQNMYVFAYYSEYYKENNIYYVIKVEIPTTYQDNLYRQFSSLINNISIVTIIFMLLIIFFLFI